MAIGFATAFPLSLALMFGIRDVDAVLDSSLPSAEIFYQITGSMGLTTFLTCWVIVVYYCTSITNHTPFHRTDSSSFLDQPMGDSRTNDLGIRA